jgi:pimeloyl-ACP methyl ester carboxylesterase
VAADLSRLALALTALLLASCAHPAADFDKAAASLGLRRTVIPGAAFHHVVYRHDGARTGTLHLYIDGDGTPWMGGYPTADPTPRDPLVLRLMARDPARSAYVGRPCYNGMNDAACAPPLWTRDRYGPEVLDSMTEAVRRLLAAEREQEIAWFGHSGGGTLAVLLAPRFTETRGVTTIAGVLDTAAWARAVAHEDLGGSLNPADQQPLPPAIRQRHYAGADDPVAPPRLMEAGARRLGGHLIVVEGFDHACCWEQAWNAILAEAPDF